MVDLVVDLWKKLLKGEKFYVEEEVMIGKMCEILFNGIMRNGSLKEVIKSVNLFYVKLGMI